MNADALHSTTSCLGAKYYCTGPSSGRNPSPPLQDPQPGLLLGTKQPVQPFPPIVTTGQ